ncbi:MAG: right-handed parallel beta-helix repeat-containing protein [Rhodobacterales bacterium]
MSKTITVSSLSELHTALANSVGGETILLQEGNYGDLTIRSYSGYNITYPENVTIMSADPEHPATVTGLDVRNAANLTFDGINFDYTFHSGDLISDRPFGVSDSSDVTIRNSTFNGDVASGVSEIDDGYGYAIGLSVRGSSNVTIENNEIFNFHRGMVVSKSSDLVVQGNDLHSIRMDGMNFAQVSSLVIEDNYIHDFLGSLNSADHRDMIQFWTAGTDAPSTDIIIRNNRLDIGDGTYTQSIFMRNELVDTGQAGQEMYYQNVLIEDNVIVNGHAHGITVGETDGLTIRNNSVLHSDGGDPDGLDSVVEIPRISVAGSSQNVTIANNATSDIVGNTGQPGWSVTNNVVVQDQDPTKQGFYSDVFVTSTLVSENGFHDFRAVEGGLLDTLQVGAAPTLAPVATSELSAEFHVGNVEDNAALYHFNAAFSSVDMGNLPKGTQFAWDFGDGTISTGVEINHAYVTGGTYEVTLTLTLPDGRTSENSLVVAVAGTDVLSYASSKGFLAYAYGSEIALHTPGADNPEGIALGNVTNIVSVDRKYVSDILGQDDFAISLTLAADAPATAGELVRLHNSFILTADAKGELMFRAFTTDGTEVRLQTAGAHVSDMAAHDISITLNDGILAISVDGNVLDSEEMPGVLASVGNHNMTFGNQFHSTHFQGVISALNISMNEDDFAAAATAAATLARSEPASESVQDVESLKAEHGVDLLSYTSLDGFLAYAYGAEIALHTPGADDPEGIALGNAANIVSVDRKYVSDILGQDDFAISLTLAADAPATAGELVRLHNSFILTADAKGELMFRAFTTDGTEVRLQTAGAHVSDMAAHDISITLNDGILAISVDGNVLDSEEMPGVLASVGNHNMTFGNQFHSTHFQGVISALNISMNEDDFALVNSAEQTHIDTFVFAQTAFDVTLADTSEGLLYDSSMASDDASHALSLQTVDDSLAYLISDLTLDPTDMVFDFV